MLEQMLFHIDYYVTIYVCPSDNNHPWPWLSLPINLRPPYAPAARVRASNAPPRGPKWPAAPLRPRWVRSSRRRSCRLRLHRPASNPRWLSGAEATASFFGTDFLMAKKHAKRKVFGRSDLKSPKLLVDGNVTEDGTMKGKSLTWNWRFWQRNVKMLPPLVAVAASTYQRNCWFCPNNGSNSLAKSPALRTTPQQSTPGSSVEYPPKCKWIWFKFEFRKRSCCQCKSYLV